MKISISLEDEQVEFLDAVARERGASRSAVVQLAVRRLRTSELGDEYEAAWAEWSESGENEAWEGAIGDGLGPHAAR